jgi:hypothetical protein
VGREVTEYHLCVLSDGRIMSGDRVAVAWIGSGLVFALERRQVLTLLGRKPVGIKAVSVRPSARSGQKDGFAARLARISWDRSTVH